MIQTKESAKSFHFHGVKDLLKLLCLLPVREYTEEMGFKV